MIFSAFGKAVMQLSDPRFRRVLWLGVALSIALLVGCYAGLLWLIEAIDPGSFQIPGVGPITWLGDLLSWGSLFVMLFLSMFLMIPVASAITSMFLDDVANAVEDEYYPHLPKPPAVSFWDAARDTVNFLGVLIGANILALALYVFFPFIAPLIFFGLNGFLLGREYFQIAAMRREGREGAKELRQKHRGTIWMAGCLMALPLAIPLVNLLIPVLGAATFTHIYHRLAGTSR
ncbi:EI24 domain-containing protein [Flavimaricola marinus]|uniref:CysZ-like protein n=1 Tax=Flavimaricola marinus TaxID=1819565 RepID=A0A238LG87_9RHOB|nr:EI24 domain-containing protein [Flavimaricola marinus]SMY08651.1 CysZ-like protein [Flavimaricola marinus]